MNVNVSVSLFAAVVGAVTIIGEANGSEQQDAGLIAQLLDGNVVVRIDPAASVVDTVYASPLWSTQQLTVSPSGALLGLVEIEEGVVRNGDYVTLPRRRLTVLDWNGDVQTILADVHRYTWCCYGDTVVAILGPYHEGGVGFSYRGTVLLDVRTGGQQAIELPEPAKAVAWAPFDQRIYFLSIKAPQRAIRFDPETNTVTRTAYASIWFSPSGRYYLHYDLEGTSGARGWHLIERESGREIRLPDTSLGGIQGWAFDTGDQLLLARTQVTDYQVHGMVASGSSRVIGYTIFDVSRMAVSQRVEGELLPNGVVARGGIAIRRDGDIVVIREPRP